MQSELHAKWPSLRASVCVASESADVEVRARAIRRDTHYYR